MAEFSDLAEMCYRCFFIGLRRYIIFFLFAGAVFADATEINDMKDLNMIVVDEKNCSKRETIVTQHWIDVGSC